MRPYAQWLRLVYISVLGVCPAEILNQWPWRAAALEQISPAGWSVTRKELVFTLSSIRMSTYAICAKVT